MSPSQKKQQLLSLQSKIIDIAGESMLEHKEEIVALLVNQQYEENVDSNDNPLRSPYSQKTYGGHRTNYRQLKADMRGGERTDFRLTGDFHAGMDLRIDGDMYEIFSPVTDSEGVLLSDRLKKWNSDDASEIMLLTDENKIKAAEIIEATFLEKVNLILD